MTKKIVGRVDSALNIVRQVLKNELATVERRISWTRSDVRASEVYAKGKATGTDQQFAELNKYKNQLRKLYSARRKIRAAMEVACTAIKGTRK